MSQTENRMCQWRDCTDFASKHVICSESHEVGWGERGYEFQLLKWHIDLCETHLSGLPGHYSLTDTRELDRGCSEDCYSNQLHT